MSPSALSEDGRRDLIARQHRALYGAEGPSYLPNAGITDEGSSRDPAANSQNLTGTGNRGPSPRGVDHFGMQGQTGVATDPPMQGVVQDSARDKAASPGGQPAPGFGTFEATTQSTAKASTTPVGEDSSHARQLSKSTTAPLAGSMGPIGSRPAATQVPGQQPLSKRTTSPLPTTVPYGFTASEQNNERANSSNSNAGKENAPNTNLGGWGSGSGVWGSNKIGATSVWG